MIIKEINGQKKKKGLFIDEIHKYEAEALKDNKVEAKSLQLPVQTRWYSVKNKLSTLKSAKPVLERMAIDNHFEFSTEIRRIIKNEVFWERLQYFNEFLAPLIKGNITDESVPVKVVSAPLVNKAIN